MKNVTAAVEAAESRRVCGFHLSLMEIPSTERKENIVLLAGISEELHAFVFMHTPE